MAELIIREAIRKGLQEALESDDRVFLMGEDIGAYQGSYAVTRGFFEEFGPERIRDCPIAESVIIGSATGAAMAGMRPIVEMMTINFMLLGIDQVVNHAAKMSYMSNGQIKVPLVIRAVTGGGGRLGATHSQNFEGWYASVPGLKVCVPSDPYDALGLLRTAIADPNPVIFAEHGLLYGKRGEVPDEHYTVPMGQAAVRREGTDITLAAYGRMVYTSLGGGGPAGGARRGGGGDRPSDAAASGHRDHRAVGREDEQGGDRGGKLADGRVLRRNREHRPRGGVRLPGRAGGQSQRAGRARALQCNA